VALPFGVLCALLWRAGVFARFWLWVFTYAAHYVSLRTVSVGMAAFRSAVTPILTDNAGIWLLAAAGLLVLWGARRNRAAAVFAAGLLICSFLAVCPGLYFREHYFILLLPAAALLIGAVAATAGASVAGSLPLWLIAGSLLFAVGQQSAFLFRMGPLEICRGIYGHNPFLEAIPVAEYIRSHSSRDDRIAVLGSEPEIYFYAGRRSVTPYVYIYPLWKLSRWRRRCRRSLFMTSKPGAPNTWWSLPSAHPGSAKQVLRRGCWSGLRRTTGGTMTESA
jgi:hypothetical protein